MTWQSVLCAAAMALAANALADEAQTVATLEKLGCKVVCDEKLPGKPVVKLDLRGSRLAAEDYSKIAELKHLTHLYWHADRNQDATIFKVIGELKTLTHLDLSLVQAFPKAAVKELKGHKNLVYLTLGKIDDEVLKILGGYGLLHTLANAVGKDKKRPASSDEVVSFDLSVTRVTDAGLKELKGFKNLASLYLEDCRNITKEGLLRELKGFSKLTYVHLPLTQIGEKDLPELRKVLPGCKFDFQTPF